MKNEFQRLSDKKISSLSDLLDKKYGKTGSETRKQFEEKANGFLFLERMKELRNQQKMTQAQLAEKSGVAIEVISRIENNKANPTIATFMKIVGALNPSNDQLLHLMGR